jgi:hypothetical protein
MRFHNIEQNTPEWFELRLGKCTASNFQTIMANQGKAFGEPAKKYALQLALEQITGKKSGVSFSNAHTERGHEQEPIARELYEANYFYDVSNGGFFDCGLYGDSPDGLVGDDGVIEIKSVIATTHFETLRRGDFDPSYKWQLIGHLDCTGREWVDFVSYCEDFPDEKQLIVHRLHRDDYSDEIARLRERRSVFLELVKQTKEVIYAA